MSGDFGEDAEYARHLASLPYLDKLLQRAFPTYAGHVINPEGATAGQKLGFDLTVKHLNGTQTTLDLKGRRKYYPDVALEIVSQTKRSLLDDLGLEHSLEGTHKPGWAVAQGNLGCDYILYIREFDREWNIPPSGVFLPFRELIRTWETNRLLWWRVGVENYRIRQRRGPAKGGPRNGQDILLAPARNPRRKDRPCRYWTLNLCIPDAVLLEAIKDSLKVQL